MKRKNKLFAAYIGVASVWVGGHIGPGFASGTSMTSWFLAYGVSGLVLPVLSMAIVAGVMYFTMEFARMNKLNNFKDYAAELYGSANKVMIPLFDLSYLITMICAGGLCLSGLASLLQAHIGLPYWWGIGLTILTATLICMYGSKIVSISSAYMMYLIIIIVALIIIMSAVFGEYDLGGSIANSAMNAKIPSLRSAIWRSVLYGCFQSALVLNVIAVTDTLETRGDSKKAAIAGFIINVVLMLGVNLMMFSYTNVFDIIDESLPIYTILSRLGFGWLTWSYILLFILAVLTSLAGMAYSGSVRFSKLFSFIPQETMRRAAIIVILLSAAAAAASFGFKALMTTGNAILGYINIPVILIPAYTLTRYKISKKYLEKKKAD